MTLLSNQRPRTSLGSSRRDTWIAAHQSSSAANQITPKHSSQRVDKCSRYSPCAVNGSDLNHLPPVYTTACVLYCGCALLSRLSRGVVWGCFLVYMFFVVVVTSLAQQVSFDKTHVVTTDLARRTGNGNRGPRFCSCRSLCVPTHHKDHRSLRTKERRDVMKYPLLHNAAKISGTPLTLLSFHLRGEVGA